MSSSASKLKVGIMVGAMLFAQLVNAGRNVAYIVASNICFSLRILIVYRCIMACAVIGPVAWFGEKSKRATQPLTRAVWFYVFCCGFLLAFGENVAAASFKLSNAATVSAITNLSPVVTYVMALIFREEALQRTWACVLKIFGTIVSIAGAMIFVFYKGKELHVWTSPFNWLNIDPRFPEIRPPETEPVKGAALAFVSTLTFSFQLLVYSRLIRRYPFLSGTVLVFLVGGVFSAIYAMVIESHDWKSWRLDSPLRWLACAYVGILASGLYPMIVAWCARAKGALFVSAFSPSSLIFTIIAAWIFLRQKLTSALIIGGAVIVGGVFIVLFGQHLQQPQPDRAPQPRPEPLQELELVEAGEIAEE